MTTYIHLPAFAGATYPQVNSYADLPDPATVSGQIYAVLTTTGIFPFRKSMGFYYSNGVSWAYLSDFTPAYIRDLYESNADVNRFSDAYRAKVDASAAGEVLVPMLTDVSTAIGDVVVVSDSTDNTAVSLTTNVYASLALGIIHDKPTPTTCNVQTSGSYMGSYAFVRGSTVFVGYDGKPTTDEITTGSQQVIGSALASNRFLVDFARNKVVR